MTGRPGPNTRRLLVETGGFLYDRDALNDELPYWVEVAGQPHLVIPYSYETNDNGVIRATVLLTPTTSFSICGTPLTCSTRKGQSTQAAVYWPARPPDRPPGACCGPDKIPRLCAEHDRVWLCRGIDIARHWQKVHPYQASA